MTGLGSQLFPGWGYSTGPLRRFRSRSSADFRRSAGPDVHRFARLVDHTAQFRKHIIA